MRWPARPAWWKVGSQGRRRDADALPAGGSFGRRARPAASGAGRADRHADGAAAGQDDLEPRGGFRPGHLSTGAGDPHPGGAGPPGQADGLVAAVHRRPGPATQAFPCPTGSPTSRSRSVASPASCAAGAGAASPIRSTASTPSPSSTSWPGRPPRTRSNTGATCWRRLAPPPGARNGGREGGLGRAAGAGRRPRHRACRELRLGRRPCRRGLDRRGRHCRACIASPPRSIAARSVIQTPPPPRSRAPSSWD